MVVAVIYFIGMVFVFVIAYLHNKKAPKPNRFTFKEVAGTSLLSWFMVIVMLVFAIKNQFEEE